jgi:cation transport regulator ChaC
VSVGVFGYGSLILPESIELVLGHRVATSPPVRLRGWRRRFSQVRDNLNCEKTFECEGGRRPTWILGLNVEEVEDDSGPVNGVVLDLTEKELDRLDIREIRYDRVDVTDLIEGNSRLPNRIITYTAKPDHFAPEPPEGAVILRSYADAIERGFTALGADQLEHYHRTTGPYPVELVDAILVIDHIPEGNPRAW